MKYIFAFFISCTILSCSTQNLSKYSTVEYEAGACFGFCPIFKMTIQSDRMAVIEAEHFTFEKGGNKDQFSQPREGTFKATIKEEDFKKLKHLLDRTDLKSLQDEYKNRNISDLPTSYLRIKYTDGSSKNIEDYGKNGTLKLRAIYEFMEGLRLSQKWTRVKD